MILVILKLFISVAILYGLYLLYKRKATNPWQFAQGNQQRSSKHLEAKLVRLLNGDMLAAKRLIALAKTKNPDRSMDWCVEKVIFDLQRDRGRY